ncbi:MAG: ABC transporter permease, partial [Pseudonocardia sediminis]
MSTSLGTGATIALVARREIRMQLRSRTFLYGLLAVIAIFAVYALVFSFIGSQSSSATIGVTPEARPIAAAVQQAGRDDGIDITTVDVSPAAGTEQVRSGDLDVLLTGGPGSYQLVGRDSIDSDVGPIVERTVRQQALDQALRAAGTDPASLEQASTVRTETLVPEDPLPGQRLGVAIATAILLFFSLTTFGGAVAQGVV